MIVEGVTAGALTFTPHNKDQFYLYRSTSIQHSDVMNTKPNYMKNRINKPTKDESIEGLRGIAIILVVSFHVANDAPLESVKQIYDYLSYTFQNIRMPLFTMLSGYLYAARPVKNGKYKSFVSGKLHRLILPMFTVVTIQFLFSALAPSVRNSEYIGDIWKVYIYPYEHFWFIQSIFLIFLLVGLLDSFGIIDSISRWLSFLIVSIAMYLIRPDVYAEIEIFSIGGSIYLMPFFLTGVGFARYPDKTLSKKVIVSAVAIFSLFLLLQQCAWFFNLPLNTTKSSVSGVAMGITACILLFYWRALFKFRLLVFVGGYAYCIYLYQAFGAAIGRRISGNLLELDDHQYFILTVSITLFSGIVVEHFISKNRALRKIFLGLK